MNARALRVLYEVLAAGGLNRALAAADVPDSRLVELVDGVAPLPRVALDLGCGTGRSTLSLARHNWHAVGVDMLGRAVDKARSRAVGAAASATFIHGDVTKLDDPVSATATT
jgi:SAM-dependent methyltransferase